jgi:hypothetical protein
MESEKGEDKGKMIKRRESRTRIRAMDQSTMQRM